MDGVITWGLQCTDRVESLLVGAVPKNVWLCLRGLTCMVVGVTPIVRVCRSGEDQECVAFLVGATSMAGSTSEINCDHWLLDSAGPVIASSLQ